MAVALMSDEQIRAIAMEAAELGARRALEATRASELTTAQAAELLGCSAKTLRKRVRAGDLPARRHGKDFRFKVADLEAYQKGGPTSADVKGILASVGVK